MRTLKVGATGADVTALQHALNARGGARGFPSVDADGEYGKQTDAAVERTSRALGALESTIAQPGATVGEQRIIRNPLLRTPAQLARAAARARRRKKDQATAAHGPAAALREARKYIGKTEDPAGSNTAPWGLGAWIKHLLGLNYGVFWCGIFAGHCLEAAGVNVNGRVASVHYIYDDAGASRNGFVKRVGTRDGQPGDAVGLFSIDTHVGLIEKRVPGGYQTLEGNTSSGNAGNQSNGGGCYRRVRPYSAVAYVARPRYPQEA